MRPEDLFQRFLTAIPREGELRRHEGEASLLITRHDTPTTIISAMVRDGAHMGWATIQADGAEIDLMHPRNLELVVSVMDRLAV